MRGRGIFFKSPKEEISSLLAYEVSGYFVVDPSEIESSLIAGTNIVLRNAQLKPFVSQLTSGTTGSTVSYSGSVDEITFTWAWNHHHSLLLHRHHHDHPNKIDLDENHPTAGWIKDAVVTLKGMKIKATIANKNDEVTTTSAVDTATNTTGSSEDDTTESGFWEYIYAQEQRVFDALTVDLKDFEFVIQMPMEGESSNDGRTIGFAVGIPSLQLEPFQSQNNKNDPNEKMEQEENRLTMDSMSTTVVACSGSNRVTYPFIDPFSYSALVTRVSGLRLSGILTTGLNVVGQPMASAFESLLSFDTTCVKTAGSDDTDLGTPKGIVIHAGVVQTQAVAQFVKLFSSTSEESNVRPAEEEKTKENESSSANENNGLPVSETTQSLDSSDTKKLGDKEQVAHDDVIDTTGPPSFISLPISAITLDPMGDTQIVLDMVTFKYKADGTVLDMDADRFERKQCDGGKPSATATLTGIHVSAYPVAKVKVDTVESVSIPGVGEMTKRLKGTTITYEGDMLSCKMESIEATVYHSDTIATSDDGESNEAPLTNNTLSEKASNKERHMRKHEKKWCHKDRAPTPSLEDPLSVKQHHHTHHPRDKHHEKHDSDVNGTADASPNTKHEAHHMMGKHRGKNNQVTGNQDATPHTSVPFPICVSLKELKLKMATDGSLMHMNDISLNVRPDSSAIGCDVDFCVGGFKNDLLHLQKASSHANYQKDTPDVIHNLKFDAHSMHVTSGYSVEDWYATLEELFNIQYYLLLIQPPEARSTPAKKAVVKVPFAEIASLDIHISFRGTKVEMKETAVVTRPFHGNAKTTMKDILMFITKQCISRVPSFLSNAEVFHMNVLQQGTAMITAEAAADGIDVATGAACGAAAGAAGVGMFAAIDATRGAMKLGKEERGASVDDRYRPGDVVRGYVDAPRKIAHTGAFKRGKKNTNSVTVGDFAVGAVVDAEKYLFFNRKKLAVAGMGGVGVIIGTAIGGPVGGIVVGLAASLGTGVTLGVAEVVRKKATEKVDEDLANSSVANLLSTKRSKAS